MAVDDTQVTLIRDLLAAHGETVSARLDAFETRMQQQAEQSRVSREHDFADLRRRMSAIETDAATSRAKTDQLLAEWTRYKWAAKTIRRIGAGVVALLTLLGWKGEDIIAWLKRLFHAGGAA